MVCEGHVSLGVQGGCPVRKHQFLRLAFHQGWDVNHQTPSLANVYGKSTPARRMQSSQPGLLDLAG